MNNWIIHIRIWILFLQFQLFSGEAMNFSNPLLMSKCARWQSQKWHIFLFRVAYFPSYRHMPFKMSMIIWSNTLSAHIILFSQYQLWSHKLCFWIFFPENALGGGPKDSRIGINNGIPANQNLILNCLNTVPNTNCKLLFKIKLNIYVSYASMTCIDIWKWVTQFELSKF